MVTRGPLLLKTSTIAGPAFLQCQYVCNWPTVNHRVVFKWRELGFAGLGRQGLAGSGIFRRKKIELQLQLLRFKTHIFSIGARI